MNKAHENKKPNGFTLLEVLIALAILAILMVSAIKITSDNIKNLWFLENKTLAFPALKSSIHTDPMNSLEKCPCSIPGFNQN